MTLEYDPTRISDAPAGETRKASSETDRKSASSSTPEYDATLDASDLGGSTSSDPGVASDMRIGRYRVIAKLGEGGMGMVYLAHDEELDRKVALKVLRASSGANAARLQREARAMAKLAHPNVAAVYEVVDVDDRVCVAMEFIKGQTLRAWLLEPRSVGELCAVFVQAARGLAAAHAVGLIHRDFKPENVMVGEDGRARVLDFGLAKSEGQWAQEGDEAVTIDPATGIVENVHIEGPDALTHTGAILGTPRYMAPEQFQALPCDARTDQFAFCIALYEALYGQHPFGGTNFASMGVATLRGLQGAPPSVTAVPKALEAVIVLGLAVELADRHPSMEPIVTALAQHSAGASDPAVQGHDSHSLAHTWVRTLVTLVRHPDELVRAQLERRSPFLGPWTLYLGISVLVYLLMLLFSGDAMSVDTMLQSIESNVPEDQLSAYQEMGLELSDDGKHVDLRGLIAEQVEEHVGITYELFVERLDNKYRWFAGIALVVSYLPMVIVLRLYRRRQPMRTHMVFLLYFAARAVLFSLPLYLLPAFLNVVDPGVNWLYLTAAGAVVAAVLHKGLRVFYATNLIESALLAIAIAVLISLTQTILAQLGMAIATLLTLTT